MDPVYSSHLAVTSSTLTTVLLFYGIRWLLEFTLARQRLGHPQELAFPQRRERAESGLGDPAPSAEAWSAAAVSESPGGARGRGLPLCSLPAISFFKQNKSIYVLWKTTLPKLSLASGSFGSHPSGVSPGRSWNSGHCVAVLRKGHSVPWAQTASGPAAVSGQAEQAPPPLPCVWGPSSPHRAGHEGGGVNARLRW